MPPPVAPPDRDLGLARWRTFVGASACSTTEPLVFN
jgi:hypothetical protein